MVAMTDLSQANFLAAQLTSLRAASDALTAGTPIDSMTIVGVTFPVSHLQYPPQMTEMIKADIEKRVGELQQRLTDLGVTGEVVPVSARAAAPAASAHTEAAPTTAQTPPRRR